MHLTSIIIDISDTNHYIREGVILIDFCGEPVNSLRKDLEAFLAPRTKQVQRQLKWNSLLAGLYRSLLNYEMLSHETAVLHTCNKISRFSRCQHKYVEFYLKIIRICGNILDDVCIKYRKDYYYFIKQSIKIITTCLDYSITIYFTFFQQANVVRNDTHYVLLYLCS